MWSAQCHGHPIPSVMVVLYGGLWDALDSNLASVGKNV